MLLESGKGTPIGYIYIYIFKKKRKKKKALHMVVEENNKE